MSIDRRFLPGGPRASLVLVALVAAALWTDVGRTIAAPPATPAGARIVWAATTPIPDNPAAGQTATSIVERNAAAAAVMERNGVAVNDLHALITPHLAEVQPPNDVHFNGPGYDLLGRRVAEAILAALPAR